MQHVKPYVKQLCYPTANHICVLYCCYNRAFGITNKLALSYQGENYGMMQLNFFSICNLTQGKMSCVNRLDTLSSADRRLFAS